jgi:5-methylcytosine-specific restriction protein B
MSVEELVDIIHSQDTTEWQARNAKAYENLFGGKNRYAKTAEDTVSKRTPRFGGDDNVAYSALIHPSNPSSGGYSGMSFAIAPSDDGPALVNLCVGTSGLGEDGVILGRPGHARKVRAICTWLNQKHGKGEVVAWAKQDPTRIDQPIPAEVQTLFAAHAKFFGKYDKVVYAMYRPTADRSATTEAVAAFLDLFMSERRCEPLKAHASQATQIQSAVAPWAGTNS